MKIKMKQENINTKEKTFDMQHNHVIEQDIIVPDIYPDILKILNVDTKNNITNVVKQNNSIVIQGRLVYYIMYKSVDNTNKIRSIYSKTPYKVEIPVKENIQDLIINVVSNVVNVMYNMPNERKIYIKTDIVFDIIGECKKRYQIDTGFEEKINCQKRIAKRKIENILDESENVKNTREEIILKSGLPDIYEILQVNYQLKNTEFKTSYNKIIIKTDLVGTLKYSTQKDKKIIFENNFSIPITSFVELESIPTDAKVDVIASIISLEVNTNPNNINSTSVIFDIETKFNVVLKRERELEYIEDMYFTDKEMVEELKLEQLFLKNNIKRNNINVSCELTNSIKPEEELVILGIESMSINNKIRNVEGNIDFNCVILNGQEIDNRKITGNIKTDAFDKEKIVAYQILNINPTVNGNNIKVDIEIALDSVLEESINIVTADEIEIKDLEAGKYKSIIVYNMKKDDNLWDIAKKYKTTIENIERVNDTIEENGKILIMR